jgi:hypothetical protein
MPPVVHNLSKIPQSINNMAVPSQNIVLLTLPTQTHHESSHHTYSGGKDEYHSTMYTISKMRFVKTQMAIRKLKIFILISYKVLRSFRLSCFHVSLLYFTHTFSSAQLPKLATPTKLTTIQVQ